MAGIFFDSFDHYATADLATKWTTKTATPPTIGATGRRSTNGLTTGLGVYVRITPTAPVPSGATCIVGFAFKKTTTFAGGSGTTEDAVDTLFAIKSAGTSQVWVRVNADATLSVLRGTTLLGTSSNALQQNVFAYIEFKVLIDPSVGTVELKVNGTSVGWVALTAQNTRNAAASTWNEFKLGGVSGGVYDDLYLLDGSGSNNNAYLGDTRVDVIYPNAAGTSSQFTRSTGSDQWATIDETAPNDDSDYNETSTATNRDLLNFPNAPATGAAVYAVQALAYSKKTDAGACGLTLSTRLGSTNYDGTEIPPGTAYAYARQVWDVKPSDSTAWADTDINAAEFGYLKST